MTSRSDPLDALQTRLALAVAGAQRDLVAALRRLALAHADAGKRHDRDASVRAVADAVARLRTLGALAGALATRWPRASAALPERFASLALDLFGGDDPGESVPDVGFDAAVEALAKRDPVGASDLATIGARVADLYNGLLSTDGFAAARAADRETAERVRDLLARELGAGTATPRVAAKLVAAWSWPVSYSETVVRTSYNRAVTDGRFAEARRLEAASGLRFGFEFRTAGDSNVRETHRLMDGVKARQDDQIWSSLSPPLDFNCRCFLITIVGDEVPEGFVRAPAGAVAAPGFGRRLE